MADHLVVPGPDRADALYRAHGRALRAFVRSRVRDLGVAEDICQETFVAALDRGVPEDGVGRWLFGIARNKVLKHIRDSKGPALAVQERPSAREADPAQSLARDDEHARVRQAVADLDDALREVVRLRYEGGLSYQEIADYLDLPHSTVQGRLKRARIALRDALLPEGGPA
jgi:RNA polymerase sigma-70 factor (ECF subfamily)